MGRARKSMRVNYMCAKQKYRLANEDLTLKLLNHISEALSLILIKITPRGG